MANPSSSDANADPKGNKPEKSEKSDVTILNEQIEAHKKADNERSWIGYVASQVWRGDRSTLGDLEKLQRDAQQAEQRGDRDKLSSMSREIKDKVAADKRAVGIQDDIGTYTSGTLKMAGLFVGAGRFTAVSKLGLIGMEGAGATGAIGMAGSVGIHALDRAKVGDNTSDALSNLAIGGAQGLLTKSLFNGIGTAKFSGTRGTLLGEVGTVLETNTGKGVLLGSASRFSELSFNGEIYKNDKGERSITSGIANVVTGTFDPKALAVDTIMFGGVNAATAKMIGSRQISQMAHTTLTSATLGLTTGTYSEYERQTKLGEQLDWSEIARRGALNTLSFAVGGAAAGRVNMSMESRIAPPTDRSVPDRSLPDRSVPNADVAPRETAPPNETVPRRSVAAGESALLPNDPLRIAKISDLVKPILPEHASLARTNVEFELAAYRTTNGTSLADSIKSFTTADGAKLTEQQQNRLLDTLAEVREHYASYRTPQRTTETSQQNNWIHAQGKLSVVLETARKTGLTAEQTEDALLAATLSDSIKTPGNFFEHQLDSAANAERILRSRNDGLSEERIQGIVRSIREEGSNPPEFMAHTYNNIIREGLRAQGPTLESAFGKIARGEAMTAHEAEVISVTAERINGGKPFTAKEAGLYRAELADKVVQGRSPILDQDSEAAVGLMKKMLNSHTFDAPRVRDADGSMRLDLTDHERALLRTTGASEWYVPDPRNAWAPIEQTLRESNARANYATADGYARMIAARGPETNRYFGDTHINDSFESVRRSQVTSQSSLPIDAMLRVDASAVATKPAIDRAKAEVDNWLRSKLGIKDGEELPAVPYWGRTADHAPVRIEYPKRTDEVDKDWWSIKKTPESQRTPEQQAFLEAHRYDGLNDRQIADYKLAMEIRDRFALELERQNFAGHVPTDIRPVSELAAFVNSRQVDTLRPTTPQEDARTLEVNRLRAEHNRDIDGRPADQQFREKIEARFPTLTREEMAIGKSQLRQELSQVKSSDGTSVLTKLDSFTGADGRPFSVKQKDRILSALTQVREHYVSHRNIDRTMDADQEASWIHTQGELGHILDSAKRNGLTLQQAEDAALGGMFSDSVKAKANFHVHHLDGALAADHALRPLLDAEFTPERLNGIVQAIREHQTGPPGFMGFLYAGPFSPPRIQLAMEGNSLLEALRKPETQRTDADNRLVNGLAQRVNEGTPLTAEQTEAFVTELTDKQNNKKDMVLDTDAAALQSLSAKIGKPLTSELVPTPEGGWELKLTNHERQLMSRTGTDHWYVHQPGTPWYRVAQSLIDGDSIDNAGFAKYVKIRGPETESPFTDKHVDDSIKSIEGSRISAMTIMSEPGRQLMNAFDQNSQQAAVRARARVDEWLRSEGHNPEEVPFWGKRTTVNDKGETVEQRAELAYPQRPKDIDAKWWQIHRVPEHLRTPEQREFWLAHRYDGLNEQQIADFKLALQIRDRFANELRRQQRLDDSFTPEFLPIRELPRPRIMEINRNDFFGKGDEGEVYGNGDGTVSKVYTWEGRDPQKIQEAHERLSAGGIRVPQVVETGITPEGLPVARIQQIGDGSNYLDLLNLGRLTRAEQAVARREYWEMVDRLRSLGLETDLKVRNTTFHEGHLWLLDPGFVRPGDMPESYASLMAGTVLGPRPVPN